MFGFGFWKTDKSMTKKKKKKKRKPKNNRNHTNWRNTPFLGSLVVEILEFCHRLLSFSRVKSISECFSSPSPRDLLHRPLLPRKSRGDICKKKKIKSKKTNKRRKRKRNTKSWKWVARTTWNQKNKHRQSCVLSSNRILIKARDRCFSLLYCLVGFLFVRLLAAKLARFHKTKVNFGFSFGFGFCLFVFCPFVPFFFGWFFFFSQQQIQDLRRKTRTWCQVCSWDSRCCLVNSFCQDFVQKLKTKTKHKKQTPKKRQNKNNTFFFDVHEQMTGTQHGLNFALTFWLPQFFVYNLHLWNRVCFVTTDK